MREGKPIISFRESVWSRGDPKRKEQNSLGYEASKNWFFSKDLIEKNRSEGALYRGGGRGSRQYLGLSDNARAILI